MISLVDNIKPIVENMSNKDTPTFFEVFTALAFQYFDDKNVDFAVIEVGLGGRFDATNIVEPMVSIITNVTMEHENILGKKIEGIALEKAGIIKDKVPLVTAAKTVPLSIIKKIAKEKNAHLRVIHEEDVERIYGGLDGQEFVIKGFLKDYLVRTSMIGRHQGENIGLTLGAIESLQMNGVYITEASIVDGISKVINPGRMEIAGFDPIILLDGAHNKAAIKVRCFR